MTTIKATVLNVLLMPNKRDINTRLDSSRKYSRNVLH